jgi:Leucine-rich repeat (LRR) protein
MEPTKFSTTLPITIFTRPNAEPESHWQKYDEGPGYFSIQSDLDIHIRLKTADDSMLITLVENLKNIPNLTYLDLSENRNLTNNGYAWLKHLTQLTHLNLSGSSINSEGLENLVRLTNLTHLDISYCGRITDNAVKYLVQMRSLTFLNVQRCPKLTNAGYKRLIRHDLTIHRPRNR